MSRWGVFACVVAGQVFVLFLDHDLDSVKAAAHWIVSAAFALGFHWWMEEK